ncbi:P-loop containing nucleoside triphosphate hydrolase protein [Thelonectria olida]|uniref:P-loop containing nucleoside triphosphate hydrolase protein n=1 Tax=Thelonectria olida TaxID=1576542 RepID=A0A9P8VX19_9HYPO|nr:P-loop containing nucleoside triphosphate hydrolase protein [Thelonectria olida]
MLQPNPNPTLPQVLQEGGTSNIFRALHRLYVPKPTPSTPQSSPEPKNTVVAVRIRPRTDEEATLQDQPEAVERRIDSPNVVDAHQLRRGAINKPPTLQTSVFTADRVYAAHQRTSKIYEDVLQPLLPFVREGGTATLFAHGQTGSGKTHTISNLQELVAKDLFNGSLAGEHHVTMTIVELAGNAAYDLLAAGQPISVLEDSFGTTHLRGAVEVPIPSQASMEDYIAIAASRRRTSATDKNSASSRSHAICRIRIKAIPSGPIKIVSPNAGLLYLIDLAGSEVARDCAHDTAVDSARRLKETREINSSLSVLNACIRAKAAVDAGLKKTSRAPVRQSALTKVLKHIFDPSSSTPSKMVVLACLNPCLADVSASKNTLRYAEQCRVIVTKAKAQAYHPNVPTTWSNEQVRQWILHNSGTPPIDGQMLAPFETGAQLLALPFDEFQARCLETPGVTPERAAAFQSKMWQLHTDSNKASGNIDGHPAGTSSRDPRAAALSVPFKSRIRPGMAVSWDAPPNGPLTQPGMNIAIILSDMTAVHAVGALSQATAPGTRYLCAVVTRSHTMVNSGYDVQLWKQVVIDVKSMLSEVILVYDEQARHYFIHV